MALRTVTMAELRLEVLLEAEQSGESVAEVCRRYRISRETYYRYRRRYLAAGMEGLEDQSRRPKDSPARIDVELEAEICGMRRDHPRWGRAAFTPSWCAPAAQRRRCRRFIRRCAATTWWLTSRRGVPRRCCASSERSPTTSGRSTPPRCASPISTRPTCSTSSTTTRAICWLPSPPTAR